jgi:hypothetical protein
VSARPSHAARLSSSPRLRALLTALLKAGDRGLTTREIFDRTGSMAVHSDCHELRENGYRIECRSEPQGIETAGRRRFRYRLLGKLAEPVPSNASSNAPSIIEII